MKLKRGNYDGASEFAYFDKPLEAMTQEEMKCLLEHILHLASPGDPDWAEFYDRLALAERLAREQGAEI